MNLIQSFLLAFSLSLDCFAISISQGLKENKTRNSILILAALFGLFQAGMFTGGFYLGSFLLSFFSRFAKWVAGGLLLYIGIKMVKEGKEKEEQEIEITNLKEYLLLSVATSIDALAAGVSYVTVKEGFFVTGFLVGLISLVMALIGGFTGNKIGEKFGKKAEIFGGFVLVALAVKTFFMK
jgi:putative Mn2+ efflux pump MntP